MSEKQVAGRSKSHWERLKDLFGGSVQPRRLNPFSRDHSHQSSRAPSPVPSGGKADNASATAGASSSTPEIRPGVDHNAQVVAGTNATIPAIKLDNRLDDKSEDDQNVESDDEKDTELGASRGGSQDQENENTDLETNTDTADLAQEHDMWKIAEAELRQDKKKNKLLDAYYDILKSKLKKDLEPAGTPQRQKQISSFIVSESKSIHDTNKLGTFGSVLKKAADCVLKAEKVISAAAQPCLPASIACAGVMLVLSVSSSMRLHTPDADAQIALHSSRRSAGCSLQRPG
jgi:hypothetical protein